MPVKMASFSLVNEKTEPAAGAEDTANYNASRRRELQSSESPVRGKRLQSAQR